MRCRARRVHHGDERALAEVVRAKLEHELTATELERAQQETRKRGDERRRRLCYPVL